MPGYNHFVVLWDGKYCDPEFGVLEECHSKGRVTSFLPLGELA